MLVEASRSHLSIASALGYFGLGASHNFDGPKRRYSDDREAAVTQLFGSTADYVRSGSDGGCVWLVLCAQVVGSGS